MEEFFKHVPFDAALDIEQAAKAIYELREQRGAILSRLAVDDEATLLERLGRGDLPEHPGYEQLLSASILHRTREALRQHLATSLSQYNGAEQNGAEGSRFDPTPFYLKPLVEDSCGSDIEGEISAMQDALLLKLRNGVAVELRVLSAEHYCFSWLWGEALMRIDTAPIPEDSGASKSHFHDADGHRLPDPITVPGDAPEENIRRLLGALIENPLLSSE